jgi:excinuclease ABC subunit C
VFKNGKPAKKDYRHFHVKTVIGPDDFASMREIIYRRYKRMIDDHEELPSLIVVDGGKGQLSHAIEALDELGISDKVPIVGIAKRLEEIYFKNDPIPLYIDKKSPALKLIQQMRDEAHRFGLAFHRDTRSKGMIKSSLDSIEGLGKSSIEKLLKEFKSLSNIQAAPREDIEKIIGKNRTNILLGHFEEN